MTESIGSAATSMHPEGPESPANPNGGPSAPEAGARKAGTVYGYARVSARDQNLDRQLDALSAFGVEPGNVFSDKASGKDFERPAWRSLTESLGAGDTLVVSSIDRIGRNYDEVLSEWRRLTRDLGADVVVLDMPLLDTRAKKGGLTGAFISDILLQLLSYVAQVERENIHRRQEQGIAAAKARGVRFGRPPLQRPDLYGTVVRMYGDGRMTRTEASKCLGVCARTFDKWLDQDGFFDDGPDREPA